MIHIYLNHMAQSLGSRVSLRKQHKPSNGRARRLGSAEFWALDGYLSITRDPIDKGKGKGGGLVFCFGTTSLECRHISMAIKPFSLV